MTDASAITSAVTTAFAFGWQMARLYTGPLSSATEPALEQDLPGLSGLPTAQLVQLGLGQADVALGQLRTFLGNARLPTTDAVRAAALEDPPNRDTIRKAILDLHVALLVQLTAADYRLGKAYGLGRALADTCASAHGDEAERRQALAHHLESHRALVMTAWLDDLKTVLPDHASQGVADSPAWGRLRAAWASPGAPRQARSGAFRSIWLGRCGRRRSIKRSRPA